MNRKICVLLAGLIMLGNVATQAASDLEQEFFAPPNESKPWCWWRWLNGAVNKEGITRDMEEMKKQGIGGAGLFDSGQVGTEVQEGPPFMGDAWRELFRHAVREADRCGIVLSVNLCRGWNASGPWVTPEHAIKELVSAKTVVNGPGRVSVALPKPPIKKDYYRDIALLAMPKDAVGWNRTQALDLTGFMTPDGMLNWDAPAGEWKLLRIGYTLSGRRTAVPGSGPGGFEIDPLSREAMDLHFAQTGAKLIADAGPLVGKTLQYFLIDSWEIGQPTWTAKMRDEFQKRRGYDLLSWLPAIAEQTVDNAAETARFMQDFRRTVADLVSENYYGRLQALTVKGGLKGTTSESGGPGKHWIDGLQCLKNEAVPMGEFWQRQYEPDGPISLYGPHNQSVKQAASAAHIYGKRLCQAEAFTSLADNFTEYPWAMKDIGDSAFCDGLTRMVFHGFFSQLKPECKPGVFWEHIGISLHSNITWWPMADGWLKYLARCQHMLQQGLFVADFAYLQNENIPCFMAKRFKQTPLQPTGFDYDGINAETLLSRASAKDGRLMLPDGMSYRYLVLPHQAKSILSPTTLNKINDLAEAGVTVIGPESFAGTVRKLRRETLNTVVQTDGLAADIEFRNTSSKADLDWIHRRDGKTEIYFISNQGLADADAEVVFRVGGMQPELWDAVTGKIRDLPEWREENGRTLVHMKFAPRQSWFVVFRKQMAVGSRQLAVKNFPEYKPLQEIAGPWEVLFDSQWFYDQKSGEKPQNSKVDKAKMVFDKLEDWTSHAEEAVKYYSGIATYRKVFDFQSKNRDPKSIIYLDLGEVKNVARVRLNAKDLEVVWTAPWRVEIPAGLLRPTGNVLEIEVANLWPNRLVGDGMLPKENRRTSTNITTYEPVLPEKIVSTSNWGRGKCPKCVERLKGGKPPELLPSGLLGPVRVMAE